MTLPTLVTILLNGLTAAALYFIVASGFSLIFGLMRTVNMAHGSLFLIGAYAGIAVFYPLYDDGNPYAWPLAMIAGVLGAMAAGFVLQVLFLGWIQNQELRQTMVTIGVSIIVADQLLAVFGGSSQQFFPPDFLSGPATLPFVQGGRYPAFRLFEVAAAAVVWAGLWMIIHKTRLGIIIRAGVDDREMLTASGVNIAMISVAVFVLGAGLAGLAGVIGGTAQPFGQGKDAQFLLMSLVVVIVGGMGSTEGTVVGALLVGIVEQIGLAFLPTYSIVITLAIMVLVLALRPQGILGRDLS